MSWRMGWLWLLATLSLSLSMQAQAQTTVEYIHTDALGSVVAVTDAAGQVIERNDYEPYGAVIGQPNFGGVGFTGHVQDAATGLTYMQQRYYDPQIGKFLSVDPITASSITGANFNRYKYANNNPYKFIDPDGRQETCTGSRVSCPSATTSSGGDIPARSSANHSESQGSDGRRWDGQISTTPGGGLKGVVGDKIKGFLDSKFETDLFDRYWYGDGDYQLSTEEFNGAVAATFGKKPEQRQMVEIGGVNYVAAKYSFYKGTFAGAFGQAWLISNMKGVSVGFYDRYDFNSKSWGERSAGDHLKTWMAGSAGAIFGASDYEITYGIHTDLP